ncbi:MAG: hypothetical protein SPF56_03730 [Bacteroidaceae bacterium]|nr:hypothetical protein [Prevotellaceae bacterium]MDY5631595.1 hypothetical protein [Bacteroidaceae bacterium]
MTKLNNTLLFSLSLFVSLGIRAQDSLSVAEEARSRYLDATQLWHTTNNAAALGVDSAENCGWAAIGAQRRQGDYLRVQEGTFRSNVNFETERYQRVGSLLHVYGRFAFNMNHTKQRAWADQWRPYAGNPFLSGSSVRGSYDSQLFELTGAVGTRRLGPWRVGLRLDYTAGDLSRLRDPRSRAQLMQYVLTPSVTHSLGRHTLGLSAHYDRRKEKIPNMTTVQTDANLMYYEMTGLEAVKGSKGGYGGFMREYVNHDFQARLSYGFKSVRYNQLTTLGVGRANERIYETNMRQPGRFFTYDYLFASEHRLTHGHLMHSLSARFNARQAYADEHIQQLQIVRDSQTGYDTQSWETLFTFRKRYQQTDVMLRADYRLHFLEGERARHYVGLGLLYNDLTQKHLLPLSRIDNRSLELSLQGGVSLWKKRLWLDMELDWHRSLEYKMNLADPTTEYAKQVLLPDSPYYSADYGRCQLRLTWTDRLCLGKRPIPYYIKASVDYLRAQSHMNLTLLGLTMGVRY